jgi:hypothetical protein
MSLMSHQHLRAMENQVIDIVKEMKTKIAELDAIISEGNKKLSTQKK